MFSEYLFTNIFIFKPCLMFRVYERLSYLVAFYLRKITNMRLCIYMVIAHKTIKSSLTKKLILKL